MLVTLKMHIFKYGNEETLCVGYRHFPSMQLELMPISLLV